MLLATPVGTVAIQITRALLMVAVMCELLLAPDTLLAWWLLLFSPANPGTTSRSGLWQLERVVKAIHPISSTCIIIPVLLFQGGKLGWVSSIVLFWPIIFSAELFLIASALQPFDLWFVRITALKNQVRSHQLECLVVALVTCHFTTALVGTKSRR